MDKTASVNVIRGSVLVLTHKDDSPDGIREGEADVELRVEIIPRQPIRLRISYEDGSYETFSREFHTMHGARTFVGCLSALAREIDTGAKGLPDDALK